MDESKLESYPAAERNKQPIFEVLQSVLTPEFSGRALEVASGTGQHVAWFAKQFPSSTWQPTEFSPHLVDSISRYSTAFSLSNVATPKRLDASRSFIVDGGLERESFDVVLCTNLVHISPWNVCVGLFAGAGQVLRPNGFLITYGPYAFDGVLQPESNVRFDRSLRAQDPSWGVRDVADLKVLASSNGLSLERVFDMPANNKVLVFRKSPSRDGDENTK